ncbi:MAG: two-component system response regulator [Mucilaginibacter sp.]|jgi:two-component system response regulator|uniref:response regulator n=1 Tax=Mucilaginibacter sp. TaxID=1882438 RepID=UPI002638634A|nr:response regulator [Mucilaginibacter sp.]MDB5004560.1 two-component system response regulator [Mucilaginibacter sp.]
MNNTAVEILLVEDNIHDAELTIRSLKKVNLANNLVHVKDGEEALDFIFAKGQFSDRKITNRPKVILLDIKMPKVDGIEVLRQIKSNDITKTIPVVIMTSSREEQDIITSYNLGVNSYVVKPVNFETFAKAISDLGLFWLIINQPPL